MPHKPGVRSIFSGLLADGSRIDMGLAVTPNTAGGVTRSGDKRNRGFQYEILTLTDVVTSIDEADDYGSVKLLDLPSSNLILAGCIFDCTAEADGTGITDVTTVDYALGTVALTSTDFSNAGEKNVLPEKDVAALGVAQNIVTATEKNLFLAKATASIYLNAQATITTSGTVTWNGTVYLAYIDLGAES